MRLCVNADVCVHVCDSEASEEDRCCEGDFSAQPHDMKVRERER